MKFIILIILVLLLSCLFLVSKKICNKYVFRNTEIKNTDLHILIICICSFTLILFSLVAIDYFIENPQINGDNGKEEYLGSIGDLVSGLLNPVIAVPATLLTFLAFWVQYKANDEVRKQFEIQKFENQLFEMISLYRKNADEMKVANISGRKCFPKMLDEFKFIYYETEEYLQQYNLNERDLTSISYCIFYYGIGNNIISILDNNYKNLNVSFYALIVRLEIVKKEFDYNGVVILYNDFGEANSVSFSYKPFKGHLSRLGHYYRHLFQSVKYIVENKNICYLEKYQYLKLLRSQLSDYEYIFLFYNSLFEKGNDWLTLEIFTEYRFLKNLPLELLNFGISPKDIFPEENSKGEKIFD